MSGLTNRIRVFLLKYYNNLLGTGNRVLHIDPSKDPSCHFCLLEKNLPAPVESFAHIFYDCPTVEKIVNIFTNKYFAVNISREIFFTGEVTTNGCTNEALNMILDIVRYCLWQAKLEKRRTSFYTIEIEAQYIIRSVCSLNKKIREKLLTTDCLNVGTLPELVDWVEPVQPHP